MAGPDPKERPTTTLLTEDEYEDVRALAFRSRLSVSSWIRDAILEAAKRQRRREGRTEQVA